MVRQPDLYELLGLTSAANETEIKEAYRRLAKEYHPDLSNAESDDTEKFRAVTDAYKLLSDRQAREDYDRSQDEPSSPFEDMAAEEWGTPRAGKPRPSPRQPPRSSPGSAAGTYRAYHSPAPSSPMAGWAKTIGLLTVIICLATGGILLWHRLGPTGSPSSESQSAEVYKPEIETLPRVSADEKLDAPSPGLFVPDQEKLKFGFVLAYPVRLYTHNFYKTIFTLDIDESKKVITYSEALGNPYIFAPVFDPVPQPFQFFGYPGYVIYRTLADGTVDSILHWNDHGSDLSIHAQGLPASQFMVGDMVRLMGALKRVPPAVSAQAAQAATTEKTSDKIDSCQPGSNCYERKSRTVLPHHYFLWRRGIEHPS